MIKYQLEQALLNVKSAKETIDEKRLSDDSNEYLENYHYELLDMELKLKDMIYHIHKI